MSLTKPAAVELSVWMGDLGCGQPISVSAFRSGIISCAVRYSAASSDSAADAMTNLMIVAHVRMGPLKRGIGSSLERKMYAPARLREPGSVRKLASECAASIIALARYVTPSDG